METATAAVEALKQAIPRTWLEWLFAVRSFTEALYVLVAGFVVYGLFFGVGIGLSFAFAFGSCQKTDTEKSTKYAAIWAAYPTVAFYIVRVFDVFRRTFDDIFGSPWISIGYVVALAALAGVFSLSSNSIQGVCVASLDEAQEFRRKLAAQQAAKDAAAKVKAAQESNPAARPTP
uniref:Uncharacterized protein n=1 Tax=viral metagenome TaxID=1070528 RepID=A0A6C0HKE7_9ZZZZ